MAKIVRFNGNLVSFASGATGSERTVFGDAATQSDTLDDNVNSDFIRGWANGLNPSGFPPSQYFNAATFTVSQLLAYLHQMGVAEWNSAQEYYPGSTTIRNGKLYQSKTTNVNKDPLTDTSDWLDITIVKKNLLEESNFMLSASNVGFDLSVAGNYSIGDIPGVNMEIVTAGVTNLIYDSDGLKWSGTGQVRLKYPKIPGVALADLTASIIVTDNSQIEDILYASKSEDSTNYYVTLLPAAITDKTAIRAVKLEINVYPTALEQINSAENAAKSRPENSKVIATRSINQTIPGTTLTTIIFDSEDLDTHSEYDNTTGRFTAKRDAKYLVSVTSTWINLASGQAGWAVISKNGSQVIRDVYSSGVNADASNGITQLIELSKNDYIEIQAYTTDPSGTDLLANFVRLSIVEVS